MTWSSQAVEGKACSLFHARENKQPAPVPSYNWFDLLRKFIIKLIIWSQLCVFMFLVNNIDFDRAWVKFCTVATFSNSPLRRSQRQPQIRKYVRVDFFYLEKRIFPLHLQFRPTYGALAYGKTVLCNSFLSLSLSLCLWGIVMKLSQAAFCEEHTRYFGVICFFFLVVQA